LARASLSGAKKEKEIMIGKIIARAALIGALALPISATAG
jgi:hypothetical protein